MQRSRLHSGLSPLRGTEQGFTLIELMVGLVIALIISVAGYTVLTSADRSTRANEQTVDTQQNARIAMEVITQDLKLAGFGMIGPVGACGTAIVPADANPALPLTAINDAGPDSISLVVPSQSGTISAVAPATAGTSFNTISVSGGSGIVAGSIISIGGAVTTTVTTPGATITLTDFIPAPVTFPVGTPVYLLQCITYSIGATAAACPGSNAPCLLRGGAPITDGIEDIQFAYACDGCVATINAGVPDKIIDDQNGGGAFDQADFVSNSAWGTPPMTPDKIRLVQVTIVARQTAIDQGTGEIRTGPTLTPAALQVSDHLHTVTPGYQQFRRRALTRTVEMRNMGL